MSEVSDRREASKRAAMIVTRPGITPEEMMKGYNDWAENYENTIVVKDGTWYHGPAILKEEALRWVPVEQRASARVLDVAAGMGLVGRELHREGFRHIDAVEPSVGMMKKLKETGIYTNEFLEFIGIGDSTVPRNTYDLVVCVGGMAEGHIPVSGLDDMIRFAKAGGFVIIVFRHEFLELPSYKDKLEPYMDQLEADGMWKKVERRTVTNYFFDKEGIVFVFHIIKPE